MHSATGEVPLRQLRRSIALTNAPKGRIWVIHERTFELCAQGLGAKLYDGQVLFVAFDPAVRTWIYTNDGYLRVRDGAGWRQRPYCGYG